MPLTEDRNTERSEAKILAIPVESNTRIFAGSLVVVKPNGFATMGYAATGLFYMGRAEQAVDNRGGAAGGKTVKVRTDGAFKWRNDGSISQTELGNTVFILDDESVTRTSGSNTRSSAGQVIGIESDGIWVRR